MRRAAIGETVAHLEYLLEGCRVGRGQGTPMIHTGNSVDRAGAGGTAV